MSYWDLLVPQYTENHAPDPSFDTSLNDIWVTSGTVTPTIAWDWAVEGPTSLKLVSTTGSGVRGKYVDIPGLTPAASYRISVEYKLNAGTAYLHVYDGGGSSNDVNASVSVVGEGVLEVTKVVPGSSSIRVFLDANGTNTTVYFDAVQVEPGTVRTSFCRRGLPGCTPLGQALSARSQFSFAGGVWADLDTLGLLVESSFGTGLVSPTLVTSELADRDGALLQTMRTPGSRITLVGSISGATLPTFHSLRRALANYFKPQFKGKNEKIKLRYRGTTEPVVFTVYFESGLQYQKTQGYSEAVTLTLFSERPYSLRQKPLITQVGGLTSVSGLTNGGGYVIRVQNGRFEIIGKANGPIYAMCTTPNGNVFVGGSFTSISGVSATNFAMFDGHQWVSVLSTLNGAVYAIAYSPKLHRVLFGGAFSSYAGGNLYRIASCSENGLYVGTFGLGVNSDVRAICIDPWDPDGYPIIGGDFSQDPTGTYLTLGKIVKPITDSFDSRYPFERFGASGLGTQASTYVRTITVDPTTGRVWAGGDLTSTISYLGYFDRGGSSWTSYGSANSIVAEVLCQKNGRLFVRGVFTAIGGVSRSGIATVLNGIWSSLETGISTSQNYGRQLAYDPVRDVVFTPGLANELPYTLLPAWDGSQWVDPTGLVGGVAGTMYAVDLLEDVLYVIPQASGTSTTVPTTVTVTHNGNSPILPKIHFDAYNYPMTSIVNWTTGDVINVTSLRNDQSIADVITIDCEAKTILGRSGSDYKSLLRRGQSLDFRLAPGANLITIPATVTSALVNIEAPVADSL